MAERLKAQLLVEESLVDIVAGPDSYRDLPNLVSEVLDGRKAVNVILSKEETYADIRPVRLSKIYTLFLFFCTKAGKFFFQSSSGIP